MSLAQSYAFIMKKGSAKVLMEVGNMFQANKTILFKKSFIPLKNEPFKLFPRFFHPSDGVHVVGKGSWKDREIGKFEMKLERVKLESSSQSWTAQLKLKSD